MKYLESERCENKQSLSLWREAVDAIAAFATSKGGCVRIGVGPLGERVGVQLGKDTLEDLANRIKLNTDPPQFPSIEVEDHEGKAIIGIQIEESPIKPVWAFGRPLKRVGRTSQQLKREEAHRLMEVTTGRTWDALSCPEMSVKEIKKDYIRDFLRRAELKATAPGILLKNLALLASNGCLTNAATLLFARHPQRYVPEAQVKCARFVGTSSVKFLDERTLEGGVLEQLDAALAFIARNTRQEIRITGKPEREVVPEYPEAAVREALINAICHRDYAAVGTIQVRIYDDRLEIWNPGTLPPEITIKSLYTEHPSHPRNPKLALAFHRARLIEHWGTGTLRMIQMCKDHKIALDFASEQGVFKIRFIKQTQERTPIATSNVAIKRKNREEIVTKCAIEHGQITNADYRKLCGTSIRQTQRDLDLLVKKGILIQQGKGRGRYYLLPEKRNIPSSSR